MTDVETRTVLDRAEREWRSHARRGVVDAWVTTSVSAVGTLAGGVAVGLVMSGRVLTPYPGLQVLALFAALIAATVSIVGVGHGLNLRREYKAMWAVEQETLTTMRSAIGDEE